MRKGFIAGNWKMHGTRASADGLLSTLKKGAFNPARCEVAVFPPFVLLDVTRQLLDKTSIRWGGQNLSRFEEGAYTGEISSDMLYDLGCRYVLIGHSERRALYGETDDIVAGKFVKAGRAGLLPVLCVGETLAQRQANETESVIKRQLQAVLECVNDVGELIDTVIAYEPVWAIGTGQTATPDQAQAVHAMIRETLQALSAEVAEEIRIVYGGSVKPTNAAGLFAMPDIDGALVGGASLGAESFLEIINAWPQ